MIELAKSEPGITISEASLDRDPWLLGVLNGRRQPRPVSWLYLEGMTTLLVGQLSTISERHVPDLALIPKPSDGGDEELRNYLQRVVGYMLTGTTNEQWHVHRSRRRRQW
jgi:hypothetical protein